MGGTLRKSILKFEAHCQDRDIAHRAMQLQLGGAVMPHRHHVQPGAAVPRDRGGAQPSRGRAKSKKHGCPEGHVCTNKMHIDGHGPRQDLPIVTMTSSNSTRTLSLY